MRDPSRICRTPCPSDTSTDSARGLSVDSHSALEKKPNARNGQCPSRLTDGHSPPLEGGTVRRPCPWTSGIASPRSASALGSPGASLRSARPSSGFFSRIDLDNKCDERSESPASPCPRRPRRGAGRCLDPVRTHLEILPVAHLEILPDAHLASSSVGAPSPTSEVETLLASRAPRELGLVFEQADGLCIRRIGRASPLFARAVRSAAVSPRVSRARRELLEGGRR